MRGSDSLPVREVRGLRDDDETGGGDDAAHGGAVRDQQGGVREERVAGSRDEAAASDPQPRGEAHLQGELSADDRVGPCDGGRERVG